MVHHFSQECMHESYKKLREVIKKNSYKAVRLTAWGGVTPLQPDRFYFVKILTHFTLYKMAK